MFIRASTTVYLTVPYRTKQCRKWFSSPSKISSLLSNKVFLKTNDRYCFSKVFVSCHFINTFFYFN